jgi:hypothetical protein
VEKITLIAGFGRELPLALAESAAARSRTVILAPARAHETPGSPDGAPAGVVTAAYRPGSALSARSLLLEASAGRGPVSEFILALEPGAVRSSILEAEQKDAEAFIDEGPRAWFQLVREAARLFRKSGSGALIFCAPPASKAPRGEEGIPGLRGAESALFAAFAASCLAESSPSLPVYAFSGASSGWKEYAESVFTVLDGRGGKASGRWTKAGRGGVFGIGR